MFLLHGAEIGIGFYIIRYMYSCANQIDVENYYMSTRDLSRFSVNREMNTAN